MLKGLTRGLIAEVKVQQVSSLGGRIAGRNLQRPPHGLRPVLWGPEGAVAAERLPLAEPSFSSVIADLEQAMESMAPGALGVTRISPSPSPSLDVDGPVSPRNVVTSLSATIADCGVPHPDGIPPIEHMSPINYELRGGDSTSQPSDDSNPWQVLPVTTDDDDAAMIMPVGEWRDIDINIALDSGACNHVLDAEDVPGYRVVESPGSRRGQNFIVGNGAGLPNEGQVHLNLEVPIGADGPRPSAVHLSSGRWDVQTAHERRQGL